jgi:hypothetical protein
MTYGDRTLKNMQLLLREFSGDRNMKLGMKIDYKHSYKCVKYLKIKNHEHSSGAELLKLNSANLT